MFKKIILGILFSVLIMGQFTISSYASEYVCKTTFSEPSADEYSGYLSVYNYSGYYVYFWTITGATNSSVNITIQNGQYIFVAVSNQQAFFTLWALDCQTNKVIKKVGYASCNGSYSFTDYTYPPTAYSVAGNTGAITDNVFGGQHPSVTMIWGNDKLIVDEQKETNTWLKKILNALEGEAEKEKNEAIQQGNSSTSQGMDAIEDKGGDFANSIGGLTGSMSYSGTQCAWEFPEVRLPAIPGVMSEVVLIQRQPIDFAQWVNAIPSDILLVVQSVCTIGLIVYCFKELYNTIAYVLTLRRDDNE